MKIKDLHIYGSKARLQFLKEEYDWAGKNATKWERDGHLVVMAHEPPQKKKKKDSDDADAANRPRRRSNGHHRVKKFD